MLKWDLGALPVPVDLLVYSLEEWHDLSAGESRLARTLAREAIWVFPLHGAFFEACQERLRSST